MRATGARGDGATTRRRSRGSRGARAARGRPRRQAEASTARRARAARAIPARWESEARAGQPFWAARATAPPGAAPDQAEARDRAAQAGADRRPRTGSRACPASLDELNVGGVHPERNGPSDRIRAFSIVGARPDSPGFPTGGSCLATSSPSSALAADRPERRRRRPYGHEPACTTLGLAHEPARGSGSQAGLVSQRKKRTAISIATAKVTRRTSRSVQIAPRPLPKVIGSRRASTR